MGKSVKLTDGSYIDAEGIYDVTKEATQAALNSRIGTAKRVGPTSAGTWKATTAQQETTMVSITLPAGKWLLIGYKYSDTGAYRLIWRNSAGAYPTYWIAGSDDTAHSDVSMTHAFALVDGDATYSLMLRAYDTTTTHKWTMDSSYYGIMAICIG